MSEFTENVSMLSNILERYLLRFKEPPVTWELPACELPPKDCVLEDCPPGEFFLA